jgi:hypothetical protein
MLVIRDQGLSLASAKWQFGILGCARSTNIRLSQAACHMLSEIGLIAMNPPERIAGVLSSFW